MSLFESDFPELINTSRDPVLKIPRDNKILGVPYMYFIGKIFLGFFFEYACVIAEQHIILIYSPGLKYSITFPLIAHMPLIDILILAVCRMFVPWT